jgi:hypothetical protein
MTTASCSGEYVRRGCSPAATSSHDWRRPGGSNGTEPTLVVPGAGASIAPTKHSDVVARAPKVGVKVRSGPMGDRRLEHRLARRAPMGSGRWRLATGWYEADTFPASAMGFPQFLCVWPSLSAGHRTGRSVLVLASSPSITVMNRPGSDPNGRQVPHRALVCDYFRRPLTQNVRRLYAGLQRWV